MQDDQIVSLYWKRDETAISETEQKYGKYLAKIAYNILSDHEDSKESVNDTYLKAWNSMPPHRPGVLSTYLGKITRNSAEHPGGLPFPVFVWWNPDQQSQY